jgi:hypothetical protein
MSATVSAIGDDAEREAFHATLAFLDEYDGDIDLVLPRHEEEDVDSSDAASSWSPAPTTSASEEPSQSEADSFSPDVTPHSSPVKTEKKTNAENPMTKKTAGTKRRQKSSAEDPRMSAKTVAEGAYPSRTRRAELEYLRNKTSELEERLRVLKHTKLSGDKAESTSTKPRELAVVPHATSGDSIWEDMAMHQFEQRQQAEIENQRLRGMLESQLKLARGLERLLKRTNADVRPHFFLLFISLLLTVSLVEPAAADFADQPAQATAARTGRPCRSVGV